MRTYVTTHKLNVGDQLIATVNDVPVMIQCIQVPDCEGPCLRVGADGPGFSAGSFEGETLHLKAKSE